MSDGTEKNENAEPNLGTGLSNRLLERLICPVSRGPLTYDRDQNILISPRAGLIFPIRDGIPIMLEDEAEPLTDSF